MFKPAEIMQVPRATCRLQFNRHFRLTDALALVPYFHALGISHLYASPLFAACRTVRTDTTLPISPA